MSQLMIVVLEKTFVEMLVILLDTVISLIRLLHQLIQAAAAMLAMLDTMLWKELCTTNHQVAKEETNHLNNHLTTGVMVGAVTLNYLFF